MLTYIIAILGCVLGAIIGGSILQSTWLAITLSIVGGIAPLIIISLIIKKKLEKTIFSVRDMIEREQGILQRRVNMMQNKMQGNPKGIQKQLEKKQSESIITAIEELKAVEPLYKWNFLIKKQIDTMKAQLYFQVKDLKKADQCLKNALTVEPLTFSMKMLRNYQNLKKQATEDPEKNKEAMKQLKAAFEKGTKQFKYEKGVLIWALYSWILVKEKMIDEAIAVLAKGKEDTESEILAKNWDHLANGRIRQFSNAGFGEQWYALQLETPKAPKARRQNTRRMR